MSPVSGVAAVSDVAGMLEDDEHMRTSHRLREVATWLRLPYDAMVKPKRHTVARAHDTARLGGELWLMRVPADLDLSLLNGASFDDVDLDGETPIELAPDAARSAVQLDDQVRLVLAARPQEVTAAFKCAFPALLHVREDADADDDEAKGESHESSAASSSSRIVSHLRFGAPFDRAFSVHRYSAPASQSTTLNPTYDDAFLDNRARVTPVPRSALTHKFLPIGAATQTIAATTTTTTTAAVAAATSKSRSSAEPKKEKHKKEKKKHRSDDSGERSSHKHTSKKEKKSSSSRSAVQ
jgi:hypothetical protein